MGFSFDLEKVNEWRLKQRSCLRESVIARTPMEVGPSPAIDETSSTTASNALTFEYWIGFVNPLSNLLLAAVLVAFIIPIARMKLNSAVLNMILYIAVVGLIANAFRAFRSQLSSRKGSAAARRRAVRGASRQTKEGGVTNDVIRLYIEALTVPFKNSSAFHDMQIYSVWQQANLSGSVSSSMLVVLSDVLLVQLWLHVINDSQDVGSHTKRAICNLASDSEELREFAYTIRSMDSATSSRNAHVALHQLAGLLRRSAPVAASILVDEHRLEDLPIHENPSVEKTLLFTINGVDVLAPNKDGRTLLHLAVINRNIDLLDFMMASGADSSATDSNGRSPKELVPSALASATGETQCEIVHGLKFSCTECNRVLAIEKRGRGAVVECPLCGAVVTIPEHATIGDWEKPTSLEAWREAVDLPAVGDRAIRDALAYYEGRTIDLLSNLVRVSSVAEAIKLSNANRIILASYLEGKGLTDDDLNEGVLPTLHRQLDLGGIKLAYFVVPLQAKKTSVSDLRQIGLKPGAVALIVKGEVKAQKKIGIMTGMGKKLAILRELAGLAAV